MGQPGDGLPLDFFIEWGGAPWRDLVVSALESMGSLHGKRVLEVGFGLGRMASLLALRGATVVGLDITEYFASNAAVEARRHGVESGTKRSFATTASWVQSGGGNNSMSSSPRVHWWWSTTERCTSNPSVRYSSLAVSSHH